MQRERALCNSPLNENCTGVNITSYIWKVRFQEGMYALIQSALVIVDLKHAFGSVLMLINFNPLSSNPT